MTEWLLSDVVKLKEAALDLYDAITLYAATRVGDPASEERQVVIDAKEVLLKVFREWEKP